MDISSSVRNFCNEYRSLQEHTTERDLTDVLGFLTTQTRPSDQTHIYYKFIDIEDQYIGTIHNEKERWGADVPCLQNFLRMDLNIKRSNR